MQEFVEFTSANPWLISGLVASGLAVLFYELRLKTQSIGSLGTSMAVQLINKGCSVIDVRDAEKFVAGHIVDSKNIPAPDFSASSANLKKGKKVVLLVCDTGNRSGELAGRLRKEGIENIFSVTGGMEAWRRENLPVVSDSGN
jgi:rhodanese-related sulfurtransferase